MVDSFRYFGRSRTADCWRFAVEWHTFDVWAKYIQLFQGLLNSLDSGLARKIILVHNVHVVVLCDLNLPM